MIAYLGYLSTTYGNLDITFKASHLNKLLVCNHNLLAQSIFLHEEGEQVLYHIVLRSFLQSFRFHHVFVFRLNQSYQYAGRQPAFLLRGPPGKPGRDGRDGRDGSPGVKGNLSGRVQIVFLDV